MEVYKISPYLMLTTLVQNYYTNGAYSQRLNLTITPISPHCVNLTWDTEPQLDRVIRYEVKCLTTAWKNVYLNKTDVICECRINASATCTVIVLTSEALTIQDTKSADTSMFVGRINYARRQRAYQSSRLSNYHVNLALDGDPNTFTHTHPHRRPVWWSVDLRSTREVSKIRIYNRIGHCGEGPCSARLRNVTILTSEARILGDPKSSLSDWTNRSYSLEPLFGDVGDIEYSPPISCRHLTIYTDTNYSLSLGEVQIYDACGEIRATTTQSSTHFNFYNASRATDGTMETFSHTENTSDVKWWWVDLHSQRNIARIELYNRIDNCGGNPCYTRLARSAVLTSDVEDTGNPVVNFTLWRNRGYQEVPYGYVHALELEPKIRARHVAVYSQNSEPLALVEVRIYEIKSLPTSINLRISSNSTNCVTLSWRPPSLVEGHIRAYVGKCTNMNWTRTAVADLNKTICGYSPASRVTCTVGAIVQEGQSHIETVSVVTSAIPTTTMRPVVFSYAEHQSTEVALRRPTTYTPTTINRRSTRATNRRSPDPSIYSVQPENERVTTKSLEISTYTAQQKIAAGKGNVLSFKTANQLLLSCLLICGWKNWFWLN